MAVASLLVLLLASTPVHANTTIDALTNQFRASKGLKALRTNAALSSIAAMRARQIVTDFEHHIPALVATVTATFGSCWSLVGENIAYRTSSTGPAMFVSMWENSPEHRANMLGDYDWQGSAIYSAGGKDYAVQEFLRGCSGGTATVTPRPPAPTTPPAPPSYYRLRLHDTLAKVASMFHTSVYLLRAWNYRAYPILLTHPDRLLVGWLLRIRGPRNAHLPVVQHPKPKATHKPIPKRVLRGPRHPLIAWGGAVEFADLPYLPTRPVLVIGR